MQYILVRSCMIVHNGMLYGAQYFVHISKKLCFVHTGKKLVWYTLVRN